MTAHPLRPATLPGSPQPAKMAPFQAAIDIHAAYRTPKADGTTVTFAWTDDAGDHSASHTFPGKADERPWTIPTGKNVRTKWVEMKTVK